MTTTYLGAAVGTIATSGNSGWFQVQLTAGTQYVIDAGNGTLSDPLVTLYNSVGSPLVVGTPNAAFNGASETSFTATTTGTYFIGTSSPGSNTGSYYVQLSSVPYDHAGNTTTNGTLAVGGQATGTLAATAQADWFNVQLTQGTEYVFTLGNGTLADPGISLFGANGQPVTINSIAQSGTATSFEPATSGTYYVGISSQRE